jgi:hypothetical protein
MLRQALSPSRIRVDLAREAEFADDGFDLANEMDLGGRA